MRIKDVETFVVGNPPPHNGGRYWVFVKLVSDDGLVGYGEVYCVPFHPDVVVRMVEDVAGRHFVGADPFGIERLWRLVYSSGYSQRSDLSLMGVLSGLETACWDLVGKALGKPGLRASRRAGCTSACGPTRTSIRPPVPTTASIAIPTWRPSGRSTMPISASRP